MILSEACLWSGGLFRHQLHTVPQPLSIVGMAPHNFQEWVETCWVHLGQGLHRLQLLQRPDAGPRMSQRLIEWKIGRIPGHWRFAFEAVLQTVAAVPTCFEFKQDQELPDMGQVLYWWNRDVACLGPIFPH